MANHKGSAFGSLGENAQPSQEMFENLLAVELHKTTKIKVQDETANDLSNPQFASEIWIEDESRHIGSCRNT